MQVSFSMFFLDTLANTIFKFLLNYWLFHVEIPHIRSNVSNDSKCNRFQIPCLSVCVCVCVAALFCGEQRNFSIKPNIEVLHLVNRINRNNFPNFFLNEMRKEGKKRAPQYYLGKSKNVTEHFAMDKRWKKAERRRNRQRTASETLDLFKKISVVSAALSDEIYAAIKQLRRTPHTAGHRSTMCFFYISFSLLASTSFQLRIFHNFE